MSMILRIEFTVNATRDDTEEIPNCFPDTDVLSLCYWLLNRRLLQTAMTSTAGKNAPQIAAPARTSGRAALQAVILPAATTANIS